MWSCMCTSSANLKSLNHALIYIRITLEGKLQKFPGADSVASLHIVETIGIMPEDIAGLGEPGIL